VDLSEHPLTPEDKAALQPVGDRLSQVIAPKATNLVHNATVKVPPDSRIGKAKKADLSDAYDQARQRLIAGEDHLRTVLTVITASAPLPSYSVFILVRGAALAVVHARHLLDPAIDEKTRLGRGLSARLLNVKQIHRVYSELDPPERPPRGHATWDDWLAARIDHLEKRAIANGVPVGRSQPGAGPVYGFPDQWPTDTDLFDQHMPAVGKVYFKYLSGFVHSMPWTNLAVSRAQPSDEPGVSLVPTDVDVPTMAAVISGAVELYERTIVTYLAHGGYPAMVWYEAKKQ
jgi:hypothetical protein